jgi:cell division protein ZipA
MKDWVIIIGTLLILLVLIDGVRRKRNERLGKIKVSRSLKKSLRQQSDYEDDEAVEKPSYISELPNGGARVVGTRDSQAPIPSIEKKAHAKSYIEKQRRNELTQPPIARASREPQQTSLNLGQAVPILMESIEDKNRALPLEDRIEPSFSAEPDDQEYEGEDYEADDHPYTRELEDEREEEGDYEDEYDYEEEPEDATEGDHGLDDDYHDEEDYREEDDLEDYDAEDQDDYDEDDEHYGEEDDYEHYPQAGAGDSRHLTQQPAPEPEEVLIINVMAHKGEMFKGPDLLDIVLKCGMRYGSMDIFHRSSDGKGEGTLLFSMANMVKPGTFDLDAMEEFETPGVSLFMTLPINADSMQSFDLMADTARAIADALNGELKDEQRSVMTRQTLEHCRQRIRDFERTRLFRRPPRN